MNLLYNAGIALYKAATHIVAIRSPKVKEMLEGERMAITKIRQARNTIAPNGFDLWIHAASLGEFEQGRPLIERLRRERPEMRILLSFFSPSGYRVRYNYDKVDLVVYLPLDTASAARRFIEAAAPKMAIFVKYEFWGNYLQQLHRCHVPTYSISAIFRPGQRFFRPIGRLSGNVLQYFTHIYVQDEASANLLHGIGIDAVTVAGDTRFDRVTDIQRTVRSIPEAEALTANKPFTIVAGSSWPPDEDLFIPWVLTHKDVRLIIAPHEFNQARLQQMLQRLGSCACLLSHAQKSGLPADCRCLIIDCFGLLSSLYRYGSMAYIGGGFGVGIHNINEAAVYGIPVVFGPNHHKFKEAADMIACGGAFEVTDAKTVNAVLNRLHSDAEARAAAGTAAGDYIRRNIGATDRIYSDLFPNNLTSNIL